ncbi:unnamed protein product, partial [Allacma fusca]
MKLGILLVFVSLSTQGFGKVATVHDQYAPNGNRGLFGSGFYKPLNIPVPGVAAATTTTTTTTTTPVPGTGTNNPALTP